MTDRGLIAVPSHRYNATILFRSFTQDIYDVVPKNHHQERDIDSGLIYKA